MSRQPFDFADFAAKNGVDEALVHEYNGTDLLPALVPDITEMVKKGMGGWYNVTGRTMNGDIDIVVCKEKFYPGNFGSQSVGYVRVDSQKAIITCSGVGRKPVALEMSDPACFDKLDEWCKKLQEKNPWRQ